MTKPNFNKELLLREDNPVVVSCNNLEQWNNLITWMEDELGYTGWSGYKSEEYQVGYNINVGQDMLNNKNEEDSHYTTITYEDALAIQEDRVQGCTHDLVDRSQDEFQFIGHTHNLTPWQSTGSGASNECEAIIDEYWGKIAKASQVPKDYLTPYNFQDKDTPTIIKSMHAPKLNFG